MIGIVVRFDLVDAAAAAQFDELTAEVVAAITRDEPGTVVYATQHLRDEPLARVFFELYADDDALQAHQDAPHVVSFHARKKALLAGAPRAEMIVPGPAKGLPGA